MISLASVLAAIYLTTPIPYDSALKEKISNYEIKLIDEDSIKIPIEKPKDAKEGDTLFLHYGLRDGSIDTAYVAVKGILRKFPPSLLVNPDKTIPRYYLQPILELSMGDKFNLIFKAIDLFGEAKPIYFDPKLIKIEK